MIGSVSVGLLGLLALSLPVGVVLFLLGIGIDVFYSPFPLIRGLGQIVYSSSDSFLLIAIPFFVLLGEILVRAGIAERTYAALDSWFSWLPAAWSTPISRLPRCFRRRPDHPSPPQPRSPRSRCPRPTGSATIQNCSPEQLPPAALSESSFRRRST